jgi:ketosteroid isomerase-like protein
VSRENVELFRRIVDAANLPSDEIAGVLTPLLVPGIRMDNATTAVTDRTYYGVDGCVEWRADLAEGFAPGVRFEVEEIVAEGEDFVVGRQTVVGTGAGSGAPLQLRWITVMWFEDGRASRTVGYNTRRQALEALGLQP